MDILGIRSGHAAVLVGGGDKYGRIGGRGRDRVQYGRMEGGRLKLLG